MLISVIAFSIMNVLLKHLTNYGTFQLVFLGQLQHYLLRHVYLNIERYRFLVKIN